jgi:hypothetical protein
MEMNYENAKLDPPRHSDRSTQKLEPQAKESSHMTRPNVRADLLIKLDGETYRDRESHARKIQ